LAKINSSKVISFPNIPPFHAFLKELGKAYDDDRVENFICIYNFKYGKGEEREGFTSGMDHYWFGEKSTVYLLGLTDIMRDEILIYMREKCDEAWEPDIL